MLGLLIGGCAPAEELLKPEGQAEDGPSSSREREDEEFSHQQDHRDQHGVDTDRLQAREVLAPAVVGSKLLVGHRQNPVFEAGSASSP